MAMRQMHICARMRQLTESWTLLMQSGLIRPDSGSHCQLDRHLLQAQQACSCRLLPRGGCCSSAAGQRIPQLQVRSHLGIHCLHASHMRLQGAAQLSVSKCACMLRA